MAKPVVGYGYGHSKIAVVESSDEETSGEDSTDDCTGEVVSSDKSDDEDRAVRRRLGYGYGEGRKASASSDTSMSSRRPRRRHHHRSGRRRRRGHQTRRRCPARRRKRRHSSSRDSGSDRSCRDSKRSRSRYKRHRTNGAGLVRRLDLETFIKSSDLDANAELLLGAQSEEVVATILTEGILRGPTANERLIQRIKELRELEDLEEGPQVQHREPTDRCLPASIEAPIPATLPQAQVEEEAPWRKMRRQRHEKKIQTATTDASTEPAKSEGAMRGEIVPLSAEIQQLALIGSDELLTAQQEQVAPVEDNQEPDPKVVGTTPKAVGTPRPPAWMNQPPVKAKDRSSLEQPDWMRRTAETQARRPVPYVPAPKVGQPIGVPRGSLGPAVSASLAAATPKVFPAMRGSVGLAHFNGSPLEAGPSDAVRCHDAQDEPGVPVQRAPVGQEHRASDWLSV